MIQLNNLFCSALSLVLLSTPAVSASTGGDTTTHQTQSRFFFAEAPRLLLHRATLAHYPQHHIADDARGDSAFHVRMEKTGRILTLAGLLALIAGIVMFRSEAFKSGNYGQKRYFGVFIAGALLIPIGAVSSITGLIIKGIHRRKRKRSEQ